jgi:hypothetical protein
VRTEPLKALVIGAFVRGLSMRDVESLCEQAGLGKLSKSTAQRICTELRERYEQFRRRDLYGTGLVASFLDAAFIAVRHDGPKEGVPVAWGFTEEGERALLSVTLGTRESHEDGQALGRDLIARGLGAPTLIVADGAPGSSKRSSSAGRPRTASAAACTARATSTPSCPSANANASSTPTGRPSTTRSVTATPSRNSRRSSTSSTRPATPPPPDAWPATSTRSWCTGATHPGTAADRALIFRGRCHPNTAPRPHASWPAGRRESHLVFYAHHIDRCAGIVELVDALSDTRVPASPTRGSSGTPRNADVLELRLAGLMPDAQPITRSARVAAWVRRRHSATIVYWLHDGALEVTLDDDLDQAIATILNDIAPAGANGGPTARIAREAPADRGVVGRHQSEAMAWFSDEWVVSEGDLIGLTRDGVRTLAHRRDRDWLRDERPGGRPAALLRVVGRTGRFSRMRFLASSPAPEASRTL